MAVQQVLSPSYDLTLVVVSFLNSAFGAYAELAASTLVRSERGDPSVLMDGWSKPYPG